MTGINELLGSAYSVAIAGHIGPDGDCVGSCMGMYLYLKKNRPDLQVDIYLESVRDVFGYIACVDEVMTVSLFWIQAVLTGSVLQESIWIRQKMLSALTITLQTRDLLKKT